MVPFTIIPGISQPQLTVGHGPDCSKDMSVHVSACSSYDFNELMSIMWQLWH